MMIMMMMMKMTMLMMMMMMMISMFDCDIGVDHGGVTSLVLLDRSIGFLRVCVIFRY